MRLESRAVQCRAVSGRDLAIHHRIRREVFVDEQAFFEATDVDDWDSRPRTVHVLATWGTQAAGAVRLYPLAEPGLWKGDRLAVLKRFRRYGVGVPLVHFAVRTAGELGGELMIASIQVQNVIFFRRLGWDPEGEPYDYLGRQHQKMVIGL